MHDFKIPEPGKVAPYGVYDIAANHGWVNVGIDADTGAFAVESIRRWWQKLRQARYPTAKGLTITADCGGSNGAKVKLWKRELQRFADETGLSITVTHLPPGTSKWTDAIVQRKTRVLDFDLRDYFDNVRPTDCWRRWHSELMTRRDLQTIW